MKKIKLTFFVIFFAFKVNAQDIQFEQVLLPPPASQIIADFQGVWRSSVAFADVDGDNDQDVLITGINSTLIAKLYTNNGAGSYNEVIGTPFEGVSYSSIAFADVDGDSDQDVIITGFNSAKKSIAKLYTNDGTGSYSEVIGTPFEGVRDSSIAFADVDGDGDQDVLITGYRYNNDNNSALISKLYTNDGAGNYSEVIGTPFDGVHYSSIAFADVDDDNDQDLLITGSIGNSINITKLYTNDGAGNYSEVINTPFEGVWNGSIAFSDIDGDSDQDVLITGQDNSGTNIAKLYKNDGVGIFNEVTGTPFEGVGYSSIAFSDIDGDNDLDVFISGQNNNGTRIAKLYKNDGVGIFNEVIETPFEGVWKGFVAFADVDGDNDNDVLITGYGTCTKTTKLYINDGAGNYSEVIIMPFEGVKYSSIALADVDGDQDQDILITGRNSNCNNIAKLYTNDGNGSYSEVIETPFDGVSFGSIAFSDVDGDSDQDFLITGLNSSYLPILKLYTNDGNGSYSEVIETPFDVVSNASIAFSDVDGDSDQDFLITGQDNNSGLFITKLYTNDGVGDYSEVIGTLFEEVANGSITLSDVDGDDDQDVLITGYNSSGIHTAKLYINEGFGNYREVTETPFEGVEKSSIAFSDVDGDGDQDVLITGLTGSALRISKLYTNDGAGNYSEVIGTPFEGVESGSIAFTDIDGDNDYDLFITGRNSSFLPISKLYTNDGAGNYSEVIGTPFEGVSGSIAFSDVDGDSDQDLFITGWNSSGLPVAKLYRNITIPCTATSLVVDVVSLATLIEECPLAQPIPPTATNNCGNVFAGVSNVPFPITTLGTTVITWTYDDGNGNTATQSQNVMINDVTAPVPDVASLADITTECSVSNLTAPTATDICSGNITGTNNATLPITTQGTTVVTWTYDDGNGNTATQTQNVVIAPTTIWYADTDNDGYGDNTITLTQCTQPIGFVLDNTDCDDSNSAINPSVSDVAGSGIDANCDGQFLWYTDADGDGYGTTVTISLTNSTAGANESATSNDCDDTDAGLNPTTIWYADSDNDGYGDSAYTLTQCSQPIGYVLDKTDCDDGNGALNPSVTDVAGSGIDANCDGQYLWYTDADGDGYGTTVTISSSNSIAGANESATSNDCDDTDAALNPAIVWYADNDNDGYGDNTITLTQCTQPIGFVLDNTDCDDSDIVINPDATDVAGSGIDANCDGQYLWYTDADGDGYGSTATILSSNSTAGVNESATSDDCDDTDAGLNPTTIWYADNDSDGYGDNATTLTQCSQPLGYVLDNTDCNDSNGTLNPDAVDIAGSGIDANCDGQYLWYTDADNDGYGSTATILSSNSTAGVNESATSDDCDDTDAGLNPSTVWYADNDNDGYGDNATTLTQCSQPIGYVLDNTDCNDSNGTLNPDAVDIAGSGIDANCDGQYLWYKDADGDGSGTIVTTSSTNSTAGVNESSTSDDCDDTDAGLNPTPVWYADNDSDGFGDNTTPLTQCLQPIGYVLNNTDCDDTDADVYPDAPTLPDGKDNDCDGIIDKEAQTITFNLIESQLFEDGTFTLSATASTGLLVSYEITSGPATVAGNIITFTGIGIVAVKATQVGDDSYLQASPVTQTFEIVTITDLYSEVDEISFYPNPVRNWLTISTPNLNILQIQLLQIDGRLVEDYNKSSRLFNVSNIESGSYLLKITTNEKVLIERIVKK